MNFVILAPMLKNHVKALLEQNLSFTPTACQSELMAGLAGFITSDEQDKIVLIKGFAGTGKTTMINALTQTLKSLKIKIVLLAPTGRAAKVMTGYTAMPAFTIHKKIYRQKTTADGMGHFVLDKNLHKNTWFVVDEASMISNENNENSVFGSGRLLNDLLEYVYSGVNCRLILVGDTAQLPPVGLTLSPALETVSIIREGFNVDEYVLTEVVRQAAGSGILSCATQIRQLIEEQVNTGFFQLDLSAFDDISRISGGDLIEEISSCYDKYGIFETTIVTRSNKRANLFNKGIRGSILYRENEIERGDLLMIVKNNYHWIDDESKLDFIANGDIAEVVSIYGYEELYGFRYADVCLRFVDYEDVELDCKIFLDTLSIESASFSYEQNRQLFNAVSEDYMEIRNKRERWKKIKENPYFNALQVKYAYALTCHKAQGGQWKAVFVDHGYLTEEMLDNDYYRWLYTAFTRPVEKLFLVNFNKKFFEETGE
ncbi:exodeoxyribonuclease-5 [Mariniphaga anaerophila]|uniref:Exodeoxyribonuclease-5 n=1 Tax=Mariniphaga anaerophila TaxID=1484053 RepID=A0A1M4SI01_9BACT|nr:AAA family ATPase [Mariniphaga anaerophila]SHE31819.1 exodeoxyribonuclease-5 [Mariniphaga anaerophila]